MRVLIFVIFAYFSFAANAQYYPQRGHAVACRSNELISNLGQVLYTFSFPPNCQIGLEQAKNNNGRFCDGNNLIKEDGAYVHHFSFEDYCLKALSEIKANGFGAYCDYGALFQVYRGPINYFNFSDQCQLALGQITQNRGYFCNVSRLTSFTGQVVKDYIFESACKEALVGIGKNL